MLVRLMAIFAGHPLMWMCATGKVVEEHDGASLLSAGSTRVRIPAREQQKSPASLRGIFRVRGGPPLDPNTPGIPSSSSGSEASYPSGQKHQSMISLRHELR